MQQDALTVLSFDRITLNSFSPFGFWTGILTKQGGFVKNWKVRYFSLTWNHLSYYEENKLFIASIPLNSCIRVEPIKEEPWIFHLVTRDRTFVFQAETRQERQQWIDALSALIAIHKVIPADDKSHNLKHSSEIRKIAFHVFRIINGLRVLNDTHKNLRECTEQMSIALFGLLKSYAAQVTDKTDTDKRNRSEEIYARCLTMKQAVLLLKQEIPSEYRIDAEEAGFDIGSEQRRINCHLRTLTGEASTEVTLVSQQYHQFEVIEDDIKPFVLSTLKYALCDNLIEEKVQ
jgi:hypothetical protein